MHLLYLIKIYLQVSYQLENFCVYLNFSLDFLIQYIFMF